MLRGLKAIARTDGRDLQMQRSVTRVTAVFDEIFLRFLRAADLIQNRIGMPLSKV